MAALWLRIRSRLSYRARSLFIGLLDVSVGNTASLAKGKDSEGGLQKKKKKKRKKNHIQHETCDPSDAAVSLEQRGNGQAGGKEAMPSAGGKGGVEQSCTTSGRSKRKRQKKRSLKAQGGVWGLIASPQEDSGHPLAPAAQASADGAQAPKRKRKLGAFPVNGSGLATLAWPQAQKEGDGGQATLPQCRRPQQKEAEPWSRDLFPPSNQETAVSKKRKKMKEVSNLENNGVLRSRVGQCQATVRRAGP